VVCLTAERRYEPAISAGTKAAADVSVGLRTFESLSRPGPSACTARLISVCAVWVSGLRKACAMIRAFETGKRIMGL
jgi:hypothetical protein